MLKSCCCIVYVGISTTFNKIFHQEILLQPDICNQLIELCVRILYTICTIQYINMKLSAHCNKNISWIKCWWFSRINSYTTWYLRHAYVCCIMSTQFDVRKNHKCRTFYNQSFPWFAYDIERIPRCHERV